MKDKIPQFRADSVLFLEETDERWSEYKKQLDDRGFSDSELWNLDYTIACFILPRLKAFKEQDGGYPGSFESGQDWEFALNKMIKALEAIVNGKNSDRAEREGLELLFKHFGALWN